MLVDKLDLYEVKEGDTILIEKHDCKIPKL